MYLWGVNYYLFANLTNQYLNKTIMNKRIKLLDTLLTLAIMVMMALVSVSCSKDSDSPEPDLKPGDVVTDFKKVTQYGNSRQFQTDLDALVTYAFDIRAVRWAYYKLASKGGEEPFSATPNDIENNKKCISSTEELYNMIDQIVERADQYEEALQRLEDSDVLTRPTAATRGYLSDAWDFMTSCKKTQTMGRKSVVTIMRELGWTSDARKLKEIYDGLPSNLKRGYSNSSDFWHAFSKGTLDSRANQIFVNVYNYADPEFGDKARDLGITPGKNITVAGAELIEKGAALVIDASPLSTQLGYGKDLFGAAQATENLVRKGEVKEFMQNVASNLINYGRDAEKLVDKMRGLDIIYWDAADQFWDNFGKDASTVFLNDIVFGQKEDDLGELIPNMVRTHDKNGKEINILVMVDTQSGKTIIGYAFDENGNIIANPEYPGTKQITVVNKNTGKRVTKTVTVPKDKETDVEVDLAFDEEQLDENPKDGYIEMRPKSLGDEGTGGSYKALIVTNYLYYTCKTDDDWVSASIASDMNYLYVKLAKNETGQERKGKVTVSATDSKGKVLKSTVLSVVQTLPEPTEYWVSATPSSLVFDAKGGTLETAIDHSYEFNHLDIDWSDELNGWVKISWKESATGWNVVVEADPNTTDSERSGTITVYAGSSDEAIQKAKNGNVDPELVAMTTIVVKQAAPEAIDYAQAIIGKWYNAHISAGSDDIDNVIGFEFTKDGKYTWFDYDVNRKAGTNNLKRTADSSDQYVSGTYSVSGNKITFKRSSGGGYAWEGGYTWGYNTPTTYVIEFEDGKDVELKKGDILKYNDKILRLKDTDGTVVSSYNWPYYRDIWLLEEFTPKTNIKKVSFSFNCYYNENSDERFFEDINFPKESLSVSASGGSFSVSGSFKKNYSSYETKGEYNYTISFDASYDDQGFSVIKNLKVTCAQKITEGSSKGTTMSYTLTASNLPFTSSRSTRAHWGGIEKNTGQLIKSWDYTSHQYYQDKDEGTFSRSYKKNDKNSVDVYIDWE